MLLVNAEKTDDLMGSQLFNYGYAMSSRLKDKINTTEKNLITTSEKCAMPSSTVTTAMMPIVINNEKYDFFAHQTQYQQKANLIRT